MSCVIYQNVAGYDVKVMDKEREDRVVEIYQSADYIRTQTDFNTNRQQPLQCTEKLTKSYVEGQLTSLLSSGRNMARIRSNRSMSVCLLVLCVFLLTAVVMLCVLIYTNNRCYIKNKSITEERDELMVKYNNITQLYEQLRSHINDGWIYYEFSLYFISPELKHWNESRRYCRERGADLIVINNKEEQEFIKKSSGKDSVWIGLSDSNDEDRWKWVDGSPLTHSFWMTGEPNGGTKENCVESYSSGWNDKLCFAVLKYICEKNMF